MLEQAQSISNITPLSLSLTSSQSGGEFVCELLGVLVLFMPLAYSACDQGSERGDNTFSINPAKNLMILFSASSSKSFSALNKLNISTK